MARVTVKAFKVHGEMAKASTEAAAKEAGLSDTVAQKVGDKAKASIGQGKTVAASKAVDEIVTEDLVGPTAILVLVSNGHGDAIREAATNGASVHDNLILVHSHDRMEGAANVGSAALQAIAKANQISVTCWRRSRSYSWLDLPLNFDFYQEYGSITRDPFDGQVDNLPAFLFLQQSTSAN